MAQSSPDLYWTHCSMNSKLKTESAKLFGYPLCRLGELLSPKEVWAPDCFQWQDNILMNKFKVKQFAFLRAKEFHFAATPALVYYANFAPNTLKLVTRFFWFFFHDKPRHVLTVSHCAAHPLNYSELKGALYVLTISIKIDYSAGYWIFHDYAWTDARTAFGYQSQTNTIWFGLQRHPGRAYFNRIEKHGKFSLKIIQNMERASWLLFK